MIKKKPHKHLYKQRLHVKKKLKKFLNSIKLFLLFSTEMSRMFSTEMSWYRRAPHPHETSERMNFNVIDEKRLIWKLFIYWYLMSFFHKINVTKCLGHHYAIWTSDSNFLLAQKKKFRPPKGWPSFQSLIVGMVIIFYVYMHYHSMPSICD